MEKKTKIITLTLNPSLDRTLVTHFLSTGYHNQTQEATRLDPAGEGLTIARALAKLGCRTHAVVLLGDDPTSRAYRALMEGEDFDTTFIEYQGRTRSNTIILDTGTREETHIAEGGTELNPDDLERVAGTLQGLVEEGDVVVFAGGLPTGAPEDAYAGLTDTVHAAGGLVAVVTVGAALANTLPAAPDLVAVTQLELEGYFNHPVHEVEDVIVCSRKLQEQGAGRVMIQMRQGGTALLDSNGSLVEVSIPLAEEGTMSGVWEALIAGYLAQRAGEQPLDQSLKFGAAAAAFTAGQVGSRFGSMEEVREQGFEEEPDRNKPVQEVDDGK